MELEKISHRNTWQAVSDTTQQIRNRSLDPALTQWMEDNGIAVATTLFASVCPCDERLYMGTLVDAHGRVREFLVDLDNPADASLEDVTANLGQKSPNHTLSDACDRITMALMIHDGSAPPLATEPQPMQS